MGNLTIKRIKSKIKKIFALDGFVGSEEYWKERYRKGGTSGSGSYGYLAEFKAEFLNDFVRQHQVKSVIEFGCGDGNQLKLSNYPVYTGLDISEESIRKCRADFASDPSKKFLLTHDHTKEMAELALSLDVIFHLTEDSVYVNYMNLLFDSSTKYVIIYSSNTDFPPLGKQRAHVRHRKFTTWVEKSRPEWKLIQHVPNRYPFDGTEKTSFADFFVYQR